MKQCWPLLYSNRGASNKAVGSFSLPAPTHLVSRAALWLATTTPQTRSALARRVSIELLSLRRRPAIAIQGGHLLLIQHPALSCTSSAPLVDPTSCGPRPSPVIQSAIVGQERHNIIPMYVSETVCNTQRLSGFFYLEACGWIHR